MDVNRIANYQAPPPQISGQGVDAPTPMPVQSTTAPAPVESYDASTSNERGGGESLQRAVMEINSSLAIHGRHLSVQMHEATGRHMVTVYDSETNEVVREIPPARVLDAHANVLAIAGLLMDTRG
jgi:uncharacterized FlaG/YvyC family protein